MALNRQLIVLLGYRSREGENCSYPRARNGHSLENAEIRRRWKVYIHQLPEYAYLCERLLSRNR